MCGCARARCVPIDETGAARDAHPIGSGEALGAGPASRIPDRPALRAAPIDAVATSMGTSREGFDREGLRPFRALRPLRVIAVTLLLLVAGAATSAEPLRGAPMRATAGGGAGAVPAWPEVTRAWLAQVYAPATPGPVWFTGDGPRPAVSVAMQALRNAAERGLAPEGYDIDALARGLESLRQGNRGPDAVSAVDKAMTVTMLKFLSDLRFGRVRPPQVEPNFRAGAKKPTFVAELRDAVAHDRLAAAIDAAEPVFPLYGRLKRLLADYRALAAQPSRVLPPIASPKTKIVVGDTYAGVPALRTQLVRLGDLAADAAGPAGDTYTESLAEAVTRFQGRHGLQPDGIVGAQTLAALNVPIATRLTQITLSLERLRWLPDLPPGPLVAVNIPSFRLWTFEDAPYAQRMTLSMPVVVGRAMRTETPVFVGEMRFVEFSPYWNVPAGILRKELLPRLARDPAYLEREDMEIVSVGDRGRSYPAIDDASIAALRAGEARLRQRPGPRNALGGVKFVLPNTMDIYLHATPQRELFERSRRDFSHGCIRVREPEALAQFVLRGKPEWTPAAIEAAMASGVNRTVPLAAPIPVVVFYTTAIVDSAGRALFLADIYGHDRELLDALRDGAHGLR